MPYNSHNITMSARPRAQDAEAGLSVVVGYSLDEARQYFPGVRLRTHADHCISAFAKNPPGTSVLKPAGGFFFLQNSSRPRVTKLPHRPKIHENTLILTRRALKQLFEFSTVV
jgi:hypothetical protein